MHKIQNIVVTALLFTGLAACSSSSNDTTDTSTETETETETGTETTGNFDSSMFGDALISNEEVSCTLENGSTTTCYEITFSANGVGDSEGNGTVGPFCPESITTPRNEGGLGSYDGATTPGFQPMMDAAIAMDADGYDIVDDATGNIYFDDLTDRNVDASFSYCLSPPFDSTLELTYLVPVVPEVRSEPFQVGTIDSVGFGVNGVPIKGNPPSVTTVEAGIGGTGSGNIPSLDVCGGHPDPSGYYHWHNVPQAVNTLLASENYNYTEQYGLECSNPNIAFDEPASFSGMAKDGFPIYGAFDSVDSMNTTPGNVATVDACNGHNHITDEFPNGVYHYHALESTFPNIPACLIGSFVSRDVTVR